MKEWEWFSSDVIVRLLTDQRVESCELTPVLASWFEENLSIVEDLFIEASVKESLVKLRQLKKLRQKELFG